MFSIVAAPGRQFKSASMILGIAIGSFDALLAALAVFADIHWLTANQALAINALLGFLIVPAKLWKQEISATTEQKKELIAAAVEQPVEKGHQDVTAVVVKTGEAPTVAQPPTPAENTERLKTFIEMTVAKMISDALASRDKARKRRASKPRTYHQVPVAMGAPKETP